MTGEQIAQAVGVALNTVRNVRRKCVTPEVKVAVCGRVRVKWSLFRLTLPARMRTMQPKVENEVVTWFFTGRK